MSLNRPTFHFVIAAVALLACACKGNIAVNNDPAPQPDEEEYVPGPIMDRMPTEDDCAEAEEVFTNDAPARLLTRYEFDNTVRDLLGVDTTLAWETLPSENATAGFENNVDSHVVSPLYVRKLLDISEIIAADAVTLGAFDDGLPQLLYRAFRRPPTGEELSAFETLRSEATAEWGASKADELVVAAILQSPQFLYRLELVTQEVPNEIIQNDSFEMASRLSYMIWATMPDEELFAAAERDELSTEEQVEAQVRRMLADPHARTNVGHFYRQWLHLDALEDTVKDATHFSGVTESLPTDWRASMDAYVQHVHFEAGGDLETLMTSPTVFVTPDMAALHEMSATSAMEPTEMANRAGLLTQPGLMALLAYPNQGSPIHRGIFVREKMLCQTLGPPPDDMMIEPPDPDPNATTREQFAEHTANDACAGCHQLIDPIGFGFEEYDGVGRYREVENGKDVDASGALFNSGDDTIDGEFDGAVELATRLAGSSALQECIADQWMTFALGRRPTMADLCSAQSVYARFAESDGSFEELLVAIAMSDAMRFRVAQGPE